MSQLGVHCSIPSWSVVFIKSSSDYKKYHIIQWRFPFSSVIVTHMHTYAHSHTFMHTHTQNKTTNTHKKKSVCETLKLPCVTTWISLFYPFLVYSVSAEKSLVSPYTFQRDLALSTCRFWKPSFVLCFGYCMYNMLLWKIFSGHVYLYFDKPSARLCYRFSD